MGNEQPTFAEAIKALQKRKILPTDLNSEQLQKLPVALRDSAFFSSKVEDARILQEAHDTVAQIIKPEGRLPGDYMDMSTARLNIRNVLAAVGYAPEPGKAGSIEDLSSDPRLNLIVKMQVAMARGRGQWMATQDNDILDEFPCYELYRAEDRIEPRDWEARWEAAGGEFYGPEERMIARKNSTIWTRISRFGTPWPPFDFNSGMDVQDVDREEAEDLGVIKPGQTVEAIEFPEQELAAAIGNMAGWLVDEIRLALGSKAKVTDDQIAMVIGK